MKSNVFMSVLKHMLVCIPVLVSLGVHANDRPLIVVDSDVDDWQGMVSQVADRERIFVLERNGKPFAQILNHLKQNGTQAYDSLHIISHARSGSLDLAGTSINQENIEGYGENISDLADYFVDSADLMFYGCDLAESSEGKALLNTFSEMTGFDVAGSTDKTGDSKQGGDWDFEYTTGAIEAPLAFTIEYRNNYRSVLSHFRGGSITWQSTELDGDGLKNDVEITVKTAWRYNSVSTASLTGSPALSFTQTSDAIDYINGDSSGADYALRTTIFTASNLDPDTAYLVYYASCCRIGNLQNNANGSWKIQTTIYMKDGNLAPKIDLPIIYEVPKLQSDGVTTLTDYTFDVSATDPNADKIRYRLANLDELGGGSSTNPTGVSINTNTGLVTWSNSGNTTSGLYSIGIVAEDVDSTGSILSKSHVDFILDLQDKPAVAYTPSANIPDSRNIIVEKGSSFSFSITGAAIETSSLGDIQGALTEPTEGNFTFAPGAVGAGLDPGTYPITFEILDTGGNATKSYLILNFIVPDPNAPKIDNIEGDSTTYSTTYAQLVDEDVNATVSDLDNGGAPVTNLNDGYIRFNVTFTDGQFENLGIESVGDGTGEIRRTDYEVFYEGSKIGEVDGFEDGVGQALRVDFESSGVSLDAVQALIRSLTYTDTFVLRTEGQRDLSLFIQDSDGLNRSYSLQIDVQAHPDQPSSGGPLLVNNTLSLEDGDTLTISSDDLMFADADSNAEDLTITISNINNGQFEYIANAGVAITSFSQQDIDDGLVQFVHNGSGNAPSYSVTASDGTTSEGPLAAAISFTGASADGASVFENKIGIMTVPTAGTIVGTPSFALSGAASDNGVVSVNATSGSLTFDSAPDYETPSDANGDNIFNVEVTVTGSTSGTDVRTITINLLDVNEAPAISGTTPAYTLDSRNPDSYSFTPTAIDPEGEGLTYSIVNKPDWAAFNASTGELSGTPLAADAGSTANIQITVSDGVNSATLEPFVLNVLDANGQFVLDQCYQDSFVGVNAGGIDPSWNILASVGYTPTPVDVSGSTRFRLTDTGTGRAGGVSKDFPIPSTGVIQFEFVGYAFGGTGADGIAFVLSDWDVSPVIGPTGGSLGYAAVPPSNGFAGGWLGIGIDEFGNYSNAGLGLNGGPGAVPDAVVIRGSGSGTTGYKYLDGTSSLSPIIDSNTSGHRYRITVDTSNEVNAYVTVERDTGGGYITLINAYDVLSDGDQAALPSQFRLSMVASTGGSTNNHDFSELVVTGSDCDSITNLQVTNTAAVLDYDLETATFTVGLNNPAPSGGVTVDYATIDGTATAASEYNSAAGTLTFAEGEQTKTVVVNLQTLQADDDGKQFYLQISNASGGYIGEATTDATFQFNTAPVADSQTGGSAVSTNEDIAVSVTLTGSDADDDSLTFSIVSGPSQGSLSGTIPNLTYTPSANYNGSDSFTFKVNDGTEDSNTATVDINIADVNDVPTVSGQAVSTNEDTGLAITLAAGSDIDGTIASYSVGTASNGVITGTAPNLTYTPTANFNGSDSFTFTVTDNDGGTSAAATVSITVNDVNDDPVATAQSVSTNEDNALSITLAGTDVDGSIASYSVGTASNGVITGTAPNLTYTPSNNFNGSDSFTFTVTDDDGATSASATIAITVNDVNDDPVATAQSVSTNEDNALSITLAGTDVDGTVASYSVGTASNGSVTGTAPNLTYTPNNNFNGSDSFTFTVTDDDGATSASATIAITINDVNDDPVATAQSVSTNEDNALSITLAGTDVDGSVASYSVGAASNGSVTGTAPNVTYTPSANFNGSDSFTFTVTDDDGGTSAAATVSITVNSVNDLPSANSQSVSVIEDIAKAVTLSGVDIDGTIASYSVTNPSNGSLSGTAPNLIYTPDSDYSGADSFTFTVTDDSGATSAASATVSITVSSDLDGDGDPDATDPDKDGDGIPNGDEGTGDSDGDGIPDDEDTDADNDGIPDSEESDADSDGDGIPDYKDTDSDNDGILDADEGLGDSDGDGIPDSKDTDSDNDGIPDSEEGVIDTDGDGIPNYRDADSDNDGIADDSEDDGDTDGDGIPDYIDEDSDNDGIPDANEGTGDTDGDGIPDYLDMDTDGDGIPDSEEGNLDIDGDGIPNYLDTDSDGDGIGDQAEENVDTDGDGTPDYLDTDSDGDGISDADEGAGDLDGDGIPDNVDGDSDGDGIPDAEEGAGDTDGDGTPDFRDSDADGDGIPDTEEGNGDRDGDGTPDYLDLDVDGDGIPDTDEGTNDTDGDGILDYKDTDSDDDGIPDQTELTADTDGDGIPNYRDTDSDGDGVTDGVEGTSDSDQDGIPSYLDSDADGDGINDSVEGTVDTDGDGTPNYKDIDSDGDGIGDNAEGTGDNDSDGLPNYLDTDADADGINDSEEGVGDTDNDGTPDYLDTDSDNDAIPDADEGTADTDGDGVENYRDLDSDDDGIGDLLEGTVDTDNDGLQDYLDLDSDADGIPDSVEGADDADGDGIPDAADTDVDGDGISDLIEGNVDSDGDGTPDFRDNDSDGDTIPDAVEGIGDFDSDGTSNYLDTDSDGDSIDDSVEGTSDVDGNGDPDYLDTDSDQDSIADSIEGTPDTDSDGASNYVDLDSDSDGIADAIEGIDDADSDGSPNYIDVDSDGDGILDANEGTVDTDADGNPDYLDTDSDGDGISDADEGQGDSDGDGTPNYLDTDSDGDGVGDAAEGNGDTDGDGTPDYRDTDADGDGIDDTDEGAGDADGDGIPNYKDTDSDGDGIPDVTEGNIDTDGDGIPNYRDEDSDADGISDADEGTVDTDGDGTPDREDNSQDEDGDGVPDIVEGTNDDDGDGTPNYLDPDSDGDGIPDGLEEGISGMDTDDDGIDDTFDVDQTGGVDSNNDGIDDAVTELDSDGDGTPDRIDPDSDGDGIPDVVEREITLPDTDGDGIADNYDVDSTGGTDADNDGIDDRFDVDQTGGWDGDNDGIDDTLVIEQDHDGDGIPDYLDADTDNDGIGDAIESGASGTDTDGDGIDDTFDVDQTGGLDVNGDGVDDDVTVLDTDGDGIPDMRDLDSDNDGLVDVVEAGYRDQDGDGQVDSDYTVEDDPLDSDGDGMPDFKDLDSDNDGTGDIQDSPGYVLDGDGDGQIDAGVDSDGDGIIDEMDEQPGSFGTTADGDDDNVPSSLDGDQDNDGISDVVEGTGDIDGDGLNDSLDKDSDNDGLPDAMETDRPAPTGIDADLDGIDDMYDVDATGGVDIDGDGVDDLFKEADTDNDGIPDFRDADSDNDGIPDVVEQLLVSLSGLDSDNDGVDDAIDVDQTGGADLNGDGVDDRLIRTTDLDNDGLPDYRDTDSDGDGIPDSDENDDFNGDGVIDRLQEENGVETGTKGGSMGLFILVLCALMLLRTDAVKRLFVLSSLVLSANALAQDCEQALTVSPDCWYLGAGFGFSAIEPEPTSGSNWRVSDDQDSAFAIYAGLQFGDHWFGELSYHDLGTAELRNLNPNVEDNLQIDYSILGLSAGYMLMPFDDEFNAFAKVGFQKLEANESELTDQNNASQITIGGGVQWHFYQNWFARLSVEFFDQDAQAAMFSVVHRFQKSSSTFRPAPNPAPATSPAPLVVDREPIVEPTMPVEEPTTEENNQVVVAEVNPDEDNDGVLNDVDACKGTEAGASVNEKGCALLEEITLNIQFDSGSSDIKEEYVEQLNSVAEKLSSFGDVIFVTVEGHTDWKGKQVDNQPLSEARAASVANYLKGKLPLDDSKFEAVGFGELQPIADNKTEEGRLKNRRVVIKVHANNMSKEVVPAMVAEDPKAEVNSDQDSDGALNDVNPCKGAVTGADINEKGCALLEEITLNIQFDSGSSDIKEEYVEQLNSVAEKLSSFGDVIFVTVEGHTDWKGKQADNQPLSELRAQSVADFLNRQLSFDKSKFEIIGFGELQPVADNRTEAGRLKNRRVVIKVNTSQRSEVGVQL